MTTLQYYNCCNIAICTIFWWHFLWTYSSNCFWLHPIVDHLTYLNSKLCPYHQNNSLDFLQVHCINKNELYMLECHNNKWHLQSASNNAILMNSKLTTTKTISNQKFTILSISSETFFSKMHPTIDVIGKWHIVVLWACLSNIVYRYRLYLVLREIFRHASINRH